MEHSAGMLLQIYAKRTALLMIWNDLPHRFINKAIVSFCNRLRLCVAAAGGHFEHCLNIEWPSDMKFINETFELVTKSCAILILYS